MNYTPILGSHSHPSPHPHPQRCLVRTPPVPPTPSLHTLNAQVPATHTDPGKPNATSTCPKFMSQGTVCMLAPNMSSLKTLLWCPQSSYKFTPNNSMFILIPPASDPPRCTDMPRLPTHAAWTLCPVPITSALRQPITSPRGPHSLSSSTHIHDPHPPAPQTPHVLPESALVQLPYNTPNPPPTPPQSTPLGGGEGPQFSRPQAKPGLSRFSLKVLLLNPTHCSFPNAKNPENSGAPTRAPHSPPAATGRDLLRPLH